MRTLVIGDIHGHDSWKAIVENEEYDNVVFLGDYLDAFQIKPEDIADAIESRDFNRIQAEFCGLNDHITPLILVMGLFGTPDQFRKATKEVVKKKYAYKANPELYEELRSAMVKEVMGDLGVKEGK